MASDIHHRTQDFIKLYPQVLSDLKEVYGTRNDVLIVVSSGTGALEASVSNFFSEGDKVIVLSAGKFGERWEELAKAFRLNAVTLKAEYGDAVAPARVAEALKANPDAKGVLFQASETSTGAAHDVKAIGELCQSTQALCIVDAITGLGTMPLDIDGWGLDIVIGGSQKAFMIPPGLAFLSVSEKAWQRNATATLPRLYFDLKKEKKMADKGESAWTPNVSHILALAEALVYIKSIGMDKLVENAQLLARATREAAVALGLRLFAPGSPSSSVTAICAPEGMDSGEIVKGFRNHFGSIIANGQGTMKGKIFRIAHLGYFDFPDLFAMVAELEIILASKGIPVEFGKGVAVVQKIYAEAALPALVKA
ncbi:MAG: alanine--glyoxylate aminotransferase family protein [Bryobacteraceae bacterium]|nr:alanine--glyoxylate aminotransferase family protein [Bryobacteraceae bacterium]